MRVLAACLALLLPSSLLAQRYPVLVDVTGVAEDDVLNIRSTAGVSGEIIGALDPSATAVEVVRAEGGWGLVNAGERTGWIALAFTKPSAEPFSHATPRRCFGTEPFWSLTRGDELRFDLMGGTQQSFTPIDGGTASGRLDKHFALALGDDRARLTAIITARACTDGMSDREFGLGADVLIESASGHALYAGCCSLN